MNPIKLIDNLFLRGACFCLNSVKSLIQWFPGFLDQNYFDIWVHNDKPVMFRTFLKCG